MAESETGMKRYNRSDERSIFGEWDKERDTIRKKLERSLERTESKSGIEIEKKRDKDRKINMEKIWELSVNRKIGTQKYI